MSLIELDRGVKNLHKSSRRAKTIRMDVPQVVQLIDAVAKLRPGSSRSRVRQLLENGQVRVNGEVVKIGRMPTVPEDRIEILSTPQQAPVRPPMPIVHEDDDLIVVDKPAGLLTSTHAAEKRPTALAMLRQYIQQTRPASRLGLIHRLDRDASGLLVFSLNDASHHVLKQQFFDHSASRIYYALIDGTIEPPSGTIDQRLVEYVDGTVHRSKRKDRGEEAVTHYESIKYHDGRTMLRVKLETGRKHQIRAHLAECGRPIVGDRLYAGSDASRLMLAAVELEITHPRSGERARFNIDLPSPISKLMRSDA